MLPNRILLILTHGFPNAQHQSLRCTCADTKPFEARAYRLQLPGSQFLIPAAAHYSLLGRTLDSRPLNGRAIRAKRILNAKEPAQRFHLPDGHTLAPQTPHLSPLHSRQFAAKPCRTNSGISDG
jgi:hypothetical protein